MENRRPDGGEIALRAVLSTVDHTQLKQTATREEIRALCLDGLKYGVASVCVPPASVADAKAFTGGKLPVCTVIGFPNGYSTTAVKCFETADAVKNGADEIDMVVNLGWVKERRYAEIRDEINAVKRACAGRVLKVIVETCLLSEEEKSKLVDLVSESDADYIKTSTGFSTGGATREDVSLFASRVRNGTKVKAAGGIKTLSDARDFLSLGADRLGTSRLVPPDETDS